jgi:ketosteroid isomerase-like protein
MKASRLFWIFFLCYITAPAQDFENKDLQAMVNAERAFSLMAKEGNTQDAFLTFLADSAVTFNNGAVRIGKSHLSGQTPDGGWLFWEPSFADISASGDWGWDTGPWSYRTNRGEKPVAFGHFVTIWKKQNDGNWRAAVDIGISHAEPTFGLPVKRPTTSAVKSSANESIIDVEKRFIKQFQQAPADAYAKVLSTEARVYRPGEQPFTNLAEIQKRIVLTSMEIAYTPLNGEKSPAGDFAYVYGTAKTEIMQEGKNVQRNFVYMHIWRKEGKEWKLVLDILS